MAAIKDLEALGYTLGISSGSVQVEEDALEAARAEADPSLIAEQANTVTTETVKKISDLGLLPETPAERLELASQIAAAALDGLAERATTKVAFHKRALELAREMPDVWRIEHRAGPAPADGEEDARVVMLSILVATKDDGTGWNDDAQELLDALADPDGYAERDYQGLNPEAMQAASTLASLGRVCVRPKPGADVFEIDGVTYAGPDLPALAEKAAAEPPPPTTSEKVSAALKDAPELGDATKKALLKALEG